MTQKSEPHLKLYGEKSLGFPCANRAVQRIFVSLLESGSKVMLLDLRAYFTTVQVLLILYFLCPLSFLIYYEVCVCAKLEYFAACRSIGIHEYLVPSELFVGIDE